MERLTHTSQGIFNSDTWLDEGNGLLVSAAAIRKLWHEHGEQFALKLQDRTYKQDDIALNNQLPRATHLLLGYAAENLLKCGIAKAYIGCPEKCLNAISANVFHTTFVELRKRLTLIFVHVTDGIWSH